MFTDPHWLVLLLPVLLLLFRLKMPGRKILVLRLLIITLVFMALAGASIKRPGRDGMIVVVADRSLSMPANADDRIKETMSMLKNDMPANARLGLVSFGTRARVDMSPARSSFSGFAADLDPEASNLAEGIDKALSLIPTESSGRIIVLSDGQWTGENPRQIAFKAARRGIPIDYRFIGRNAVKDLAITRFELPGLLNPGESFLIKSEVFSPLQQNVSFVLSCNGKTINRFERSLELGSNSIVFRHTAPDSSIVKYRLEIGSDETDPVPENNVAVSLAEVVGKKPVLVISNHDSRFIMSVLQLAGQKAELIIPGKMQWNIETLAGYSAVIIDNVSANEVTQHGMRVLSAWVEHLGGGLLLTGGKNAYGTGGYYQSPLEAVLPVSLELRSEHRKLSLALVIVLDRSGSMAAPVRGDRTKMDLANIAAAGCLELLSPMDEFGLLAVDTEPHVVVPLEPLTNKDKWRDKILRVESMGGGIYVFEGLSKAAQMLNSAKAKTRHIILFADAADAEKPGTYWELLDKATKAGMTVSVIGLGTETDSDANILKKVAAAGKGRIFFTREPEELPRLFTQDTFVAAQSTFIDEKTSIVSTNLIRALLDEELQIKSSVGGYNLCYVRPGANVVLRTTDENMSPLLANWNSGLGRVACYTGTTSSDFAGNFLATADASSLFAGLCAWLAVDQRQYLDQMPVTQKIVRGSWMATLHLDPEREREFINENPRVTLIRSTNNQAPEKISLLMNWETADSLSVSRQLSGNEALVALIDAGQNKQLRLYPVCLPYSQEYLSLDVNEGSEKLKEIALISNGRELIDLAGSWQTMPETLQYKSISEFLLMLAMILFIVEVAERRTAILTIVLNMALRKNRSLAGKPVLQAEKRAEEKISSRLDQVQSVGVPDAEKVEKPVAQEAGFAGALKKAKNQAGKRTGR